MFKQDVLAGMLGVSQAAVSRWENGRDLPSPKIRGRLRGLMSAQIRDDLAVERLMLSRQSEQRILMDMDGVRLVGISKGLHAVWPAMERMMGQRLQDRAIGEMRQIIDDADLFRAILHGDVAMISCTSIENIRFQRQKIKHHWHLGFRQVGRHLIADMIYQQAGPDDPLGVHDILRMDDI